MSKVSGLGMTTLTVDKSDGTTAVDIRNDVTNFDFSTPRAVQDTTGVDKSAHERLLLLADMSLNLSGVFNPASSHTVFLDVSSTSVARPTTLTMSAKTLAANLLYTDYQITRGTDGALTWKAPGALADGNVPTWA